MSMYGDVIAEHSRRPRNYGPLDDADIRHEDANPLCGDRVRIEMAIGGDETIRAARFQGDLCAIAKAASSILTELVTNAPLARVNALRDSDLLDELRTEIPESRHQCALLPLQVMRAGLKAWRASL